MKNQLVSKVVLAISLALSLSAIASPGGHGDRKSKFMDFFDTNNDDVVTMDEFNAAAARRFERMDADSNGAVGREEFTSYVERKRQERRDHWFKSMDSNTDNRISQDEYINFRQKKAERDFQRLDTNNDGVVSREEFNAGKKHRHGHDHGHKEGHKYGHKGKGHIFARLDANGDGQITRDESLAAWSNWFAKIDANKDQVVTADEVREYRRNRVKSWK